MEEVTVDMRNQELGEEGGAGKVFQVMAMEMREHKS